MQLSCGPNNSVHDTILFKLRVISKFQPLPLIFAPIPAFSIVIREFFDLLRAQTVGEPKNYETNT